MAIEGNRLGRRAFGIRAVEVDGDALPVALVKDVVVSEQRLDSGGDDSQARKRVSDPLVCPVGSTSRARPG